MEAIIGFVVFFIVGFIVLFVPGAIISELFAIPMGAAVWIGAGFTIAITVLVIFCIGQYTKNNQEEIQATRERQGWHYHPVVSEMATMRAAGIDIATPEGHKIFHDMLEQNLQLSTPEGRRKFMEHEGSGAGSGVAKPESGSRRISDDDLLAMYFADKGTPWDE